MSGVTVDGVRLDGPTMRHVARSLRVGLESVRADLGPDAEAFVKCIEDMAAEADDVAEQAESRPPLPSDWLRACEGTALGEPDVETMWHLPDGRIVTFDATGPLGATVRVDWFDESATDNDDGCRHSTEPCHTPTHLRAILDRLATEARP